MIRWVSGYHDICFTSLSYPETQPARLPEEQRTLKPNHQKNGNGKKQVMLLGLMILIGHPTITFQ